MILDYIMSVKQGRFLQNYTVVFR